MKYIVENNERKGKQPRKAPTTAHKKNDPNYYFYNITNPSNKIQCDQCKRDISKQCKVLANEADYCVNCFANLSKQTDIQEYHVINKLDYPLLDAEWTAQEELMLFEGLQKHGFGNWKQISEFIGTGKTREQVEEHYTKYFLQVDGFIPNKEILSKREQKNGKLVKKVGQLTSKRAAKETKKNIDSASYQHQRGTLTVNNQTSSSLKANANAAEIVGYMPKRGDFEVEYDNDAELLLAQMEFNDDDDQDEKAMKFKLMDIYNQKLTQRIRRKQFVIKRNLLDLKQQSRLEKTRTKEEKQIYNMMKVFARFNTVEDHDKLVQGIIRERQIRQRIEQLKQFRKKGFKTLAQVQEQLDNKRRKQQKSKKKHEQGSYLGGFDAKQNTRRSRKDAPNQRNQKKSIYMSPQEIDLCKKLNLKHQQYMVIKQTILRQSVLDGVLRKDDVSKIFKVDRAAAQGVFDYLVQKEDIACQE